MKILWPTEEMVWRYGALGMYCCTQCRTVHLGTVASSADQFQIGNRKVCCIAEFARLAKKEVK